MNKGIDKINLVTGFTIDFYIQTILVLEDKKVTLKESLGYIGTALKLPEIIKSLQELKLELLDLTEDETDLIVANIEIKLGINDLDFAGRLFNAFLNWYHATNDIYNLLKDFDKKDIK
jgi:hypothetical protein